MDQNPKRSVAVGCEIDNTPKARQSKMTCDVSGPYKVIPTNTCLCMYMLYTFE